MNKYVEIIRDTLWGILNEEATLDKTVLHCPDCMTEEVVLNIIATVELATKIIRLNAKFSGYADFFGDIYPIMDENEHITKMAISLIDCLEGTNE